MKHPCWQCGTPEECRLHLPDGRTVADFVDEHPAGATLAEVGAAFGFVRERARQVEHDALVHFAALSCGTDLPSAASDPDAAAKLAATARERLRAVVRLRAARTREAQRRVRARAIKAAVVDDSEGGFDGST